MISKTFTLKMSQAKASGLDWLVCSESGRDWLVCSKLARQRVPSAPGESSKQPANGSNTQPMVPTSAESSHAPAAILAPENPYICIRKHASYRSTSLIRTSPPPGPPYGPRHEPTVGSLGGVVSYERGTPVHPYVGLSHKWRRGQI